MPMTQLIRQIHQECRSNDDPFSMVASYKKYIQKLEADSADAYQPTNQGGTVYKSEWILTRKLVLLNTVK